MGFCGYINILYLFYFGWIEYWYIKDLVNKYLYIIIKKNFIYVSFDNDVYDIGILG